MAVTITKKFHNGTDYKNIAKIVFTSPNFTSPAIAGTRSHMPPGGQYMGTWFEAVDYMYREFPNQDYANFPDQMESLFGKFTLSGTLDFKNDTTAKFLHTYGEDFDIVGNGGNIIYRDKNTYGVILSASSGTVTSSGTPVVYETDVTFSDTVGSGVANDWIYATVTSELSTAASGIGIGNTNPVSSYIETSVSGVANDFNTTQMSGTVSGTLNGILYGSGTGSATVSGVVSGLIVGENDSSSLVSGVVSGVLAGQEHGPIYGVVSGTLTGPMVAPSEIMSFQYTTSSPIVESLTIPRHRRHHGGNSIIFTVTFGEAYSCRLTAWDDATHSTTNNKVLSEEHYKVDAVAFRSNVTDTPHAPIFSKSGCLVHEERFDIVLKGNEKYYGDFDLIFAIDDDEYGEYLVFTPRLIDMNSSFIAGSYDFVTTLHYQYT